MKQIVVVMSLLAFVLALGCEKGEELPQKPVEQEKTPEQIVELIKKDLKPLGKIMSGGVISPDEKNQVLSKLRTHKTTYQSKENGVIALERIKGEVEQAIRGARDSERWFMVLVALEIYDVLEPGSTRYQRLAKTAVLQMKKPKVKLKGFFRDIESNDQFYAFVEITDPVSGKTYSEQMREGEEKHGIRFSRIIGNQQGVEFEYMAIPGDFFEVMKK